MCSWRNQALTLVKKKPVQLFSFSLNDKNKNSIFDAGNSDEGIHAFEASSSLGEVKKGDVQVVEDMRYYERKVFGAMNDWTQRI